MNRYELVFEKKALDSVPVIADNIDEARKYVSEFCEKNEGVKPVQLWLVAEQCELEEKDKSFFADAQKKAKK